MQILKHNFMLFINIIPNIIKYDILYYFKNYFVL
jgi:hypothetical protein